MARLYDVLAAVFLAALIASAAAAVEEDAPMPCISRVDANKDGEVDVRELKSFADKLVDARIAETLKAGGEELAVPEAEKYRRIAGWLEARAKVIEELTARLVRLEATYDRKLKGEQYDEVRSILRRSVYCYRRVDRSGDGNIDRYEFLVSSRTVPPRRKPKKMKGQEKPVDESALPITPYDANKDMVLSVAERIKLSVDVAAGKKSLEDQAADYRGMARALESARELGEVKLAQLVAEKKAAEARKRAEEAARLRSLTEEGD